MQRLFLVVCFSLLFGVPPRCARPHSLSLFVLCCFCDGEGGVEPSTHPFRTMYIPVGSVLSRLPFFFCFPEAMGLVLRWSITARDGRVCFLRPHLFCLSFTNGSMCISLLSCCMVDAKAIVAGSVKPPAFFFFFRELRLLRVSKERESKSRQKKNRGKTKLEVMKRIPTEREMFRRRCLSHSPAVSRYCACLEGCHFFFPVKLELP